MQRPNNEQYTHKEIMTGKETILTQDIGEDNSRNVTSQDSEKCTYAAD